MLHNKKINILIKDVSHLGNIPLFIRKNMIGLLNSCIIDDQKEGSETSEVNGEKITEDIEGNVKLILFNEVKEKIKELRKINKNEEVSQEYSRYCEKKIPNNYDILKLSHIPFEEKKELLDMILILQSNKDDNPDISQKEIMSLKDTLIFRYNNLKSIKTKKAKDTYKRIREMESITYNDILNAKISDDSKADVIQKLNETQKELCTNFDNGMVVWKKIKHDLQKNVYDNVNTLNNEVLNSNLPEDVKNKLYSHIHYNNQNNDFGKTVEFIKYAIKVPFNQVVYDMPPDISQFCIKFKTILDTNLYGMEKIKEELITSMCCKAYSKDVNIKYKPIALCGPPGTGKTTIARSIAKIFNIPFQQISVNTIANMEDLTGNNFAFIGCSPGRIAKALIQMKCNNGVLFLDELDKSLCIGDNTNNIMNCLMNICDVTQNHEFVDNYFSDFKIDLSNLLIVCSLNDISKLDKVLLDRVKIIKVEGYKDHEKVEIGKMMINKMFKEYNISDVTINNISYLIHKANENEEILGIRKHEGVRGLESILKHIIERIKILIATMNSPTPLTYLSYYIPDFKLPYELSNSDTNILLKNYMSKDDLHDSIKSMYM